jgi:hypothetical protein
LINDAGSILGHNKCDYLNGNDGCVDMYNTRKQQITSKNVGSLLFVADKSVTNAIGLITREDELSKHEILKTRP